MTNFTIVTRLRAKRPAMELALLALISRAPNHWLRKAVLGLLGADIESSATLYHGFQVRAAHLLRVGARSNIGDHAVLDARGGINIGSDVNLSTGVQIWSAQHDWRTRDFEYTTAAVSIGDRVWLGPRVIVLPGTSIGTGTVVAAGSVARGVLAPFTLYGGVPARSISSRTRDLRYNLTTSKQKLWWW